MLKRVKLQYAVEILLNNIYEIRSVTDWANKMGWDRAQFSRMFARHYGENAKDALARFKLNLISKHFLENQGAKHFEIAYDLGFKDEKALYDYIRYHTNESPTQYKIKIMAKCEKARCTFAASTANFTQSNLSGEEEHGLVAVGEAEATV